MISEISWTSTAAAIERTPETADGTSTARISSEKTMFCLLMCRVVRPRDDGEDDRRCPTTTGESDD